MQGPIQRWMDNKRFISRDFSSLQDSFDRLFNEFMYFKRTNDAQDFSFSPSCEILEEGNNYVLKFDLPGVTKEQIKVEAENDQLTVTAERKEEKRKDTKKKHLSEIFYGSYTRTFSLPGPVDEKKVDASFNNGVLTVTLPRTHSSHTKSIAIH